MNRWPRRIGYALMALAAALALYQRRGGGDAIGPIPMIVAVLFCGMIGAMLVFTDLLVRSLYAQIEAAKQHPQGDDQGQ